MEKHKGTPMNIAIRILMLAVNGHYCVYANLHVRHYNIKRAWAIRDGSFISFDQYVYM